MSRNVYIALGAVALVVVVVALVYYVGPTVAKNRTLARCSELKAQLAAQQRAGANAGVLSSLQQQIAQCTADANAQGANLDPSLETLHACQANFEAVAHEFSHLKSVGYDDPLQRTNTVNTLLDEGEAGARCIVGAVQTANTKETLTAIRKAIDNIGRETRAMQQAFYFRENGTDRYAGSWERSSDDKANAVKQRINDPLWAALQQVDARILALDASDASARAELAIVNSSSSPLANSIWGP